MMNARERRDYEELRAYYNKVQNAIMQMQQNASKIDLPKCAEHSEAALAAGASALTVYRECVRLLTGE